MHTRSRLPVFLLPLLLLLLGCLWKSADRPLSDFAGYYFGGREVLKGIYMNAYDMEKLNTLIADAGHKGVYVSYAPFPPFTSLIFAPFYAFPVYTAKLLFNICSCIFFVLSLLRTLRFFEIRACIALLIPLVFFMPLVNNVFFGQSYLLLFCLLMEGYIAYRKDKPVASSVFWGIAILFKLFPAVLFFYLLSVRRMKHFVYLGISCLVLLSVSVIINGSAAWLFYISDILPRLNAGELNHPFTQAFQSFFMLCKNAFVRDALLNPSPLHESKTLFLLSTGIYKALLLALAFTFSFRKRGPDLLQLGLWIMASMLISPNGSTYSLVLLLIPFLALWQSADPLQYKYMPVLVSVLLLFACNINIGLFLQAPLLFQFPRLLLLLAAFILLLCCGRGRPLNGYLFAALVLLFIMPGMFRRTGRKDNSAYLLDKEGDLFITGYTGRAGRLLYYSWDGKRNEVMTAIPVSSLSEDGVSLKDNQIYFKGRQLTHSHDWKRQASLINGNTIIYLSDLDRGICFYTLRRISLPQ